MLLYTRRRRRDRGRDRRARAAAALDARPPEHARGRLPPPDRPHAGGLTWTSVLQPLRAYEHWLAQYKRVWRGHDRDEPRQPDPLPDGARGRPRHDRRPDARTRRAAFPTSTTSRPGLLAAAAMQTATIESSWPVMAAIKWTRVYHAMIATPLTERDAFVGHQLFVITRVLHVGRRLPRRSIAAFGAVSSWLGHARVPVAVLIGTAFSMPMAALAARRRGRPDVRDRSSAS